MVQLYNRATRLTIRPIDGPPVVINPDADTQISRRSNQLEVSFSIQKSVTTKISTARINVLNLNAATRGIIHSSTRVPDNFAPDAEKIGEPLINQVMRAGLTLPEITSLTAQVAYIRLEAGYIDTMSEIYQGSSMGLIDTHNGTEWNTAIDCVDGKASLASGKVNRPFPAGSTRLEIATYIAKAMGLEFNPARVPSEFRTATVSGKFGALGTAEGAMDRLTVSAGMDWFIDDGELFILTPTGFIEEEPLTLGVGTGLLQRPIRREGEQLQIVGLLDPRIKPGRPINISTPEYKGSYRVESVNHGGNNRSGDNRSVALVKSLRALLAGPTDSEERIRRKAQKRR